MKYQKRLEQRGNEIEKSENKREVRLKPECSAVCEWTVIIKLHDHRDWGHKCSINIHLLVSFKEHALLEAEEILK